MSHCTDVVVRFLFEDNEDGNDVIKDALFHMSWGLCGGCFKKPRSMGVGIVASNFEGAKLELCLQFRVTTPNYRSGKVQ